MRRKPVAKKDYASRIYDELCQCGHKKSDHAGRLNELGCTVRVIKIMGQCPCPRFTWKSFLDQSGKVIQ